MSLPKELQEIQEFRGVESLVAAEVLTDDNGADGYTTGDVFAIAGVAEISKSTANSSEAHYYDNIPAIVITSTGADTVTISASAIPLDVLAEITGQVYDSELGAMYEGEREQKYFAIGYITEKTSGDPVYVWRLKGTFNVPDQDNKTKNDGTDANGQELVFTGINTTHKFDKVVDKDGRTHGAKAVIVDVAKDLADVSDFFDAVTTPDTLKKKHPEPVGYAGPFKPAYAFNDYAEFVLMANRNGSPRYLKRTTSSRDFGAAAATQELDGYYIDAADADIVQYEATDTANDSFYLQRQVDNDGEIITLGLGCIYDDESLGYVLCEYVVGDQFDGYAEWTIYETQDHEFVPSIHDLYLGLNKDEDEWALLDSLGSEYYDYAFAATPGTFDKLYRITDSVTSGTNCMIVSNCPESYLGYEALAWDSDNIYAASVKEVQYQGDTALVATSSHPDQADWIATVEENDKIRLTTNIVDDGESTWYILGITERMPGAYSLTVSVDEAIEDYTPYEWDLYESNDYGAIPCIDGKYLIIDDASNFGYTTDNPDVTQIGSIAYANLAAFIDDVE